MTLPGSKAEHTLQEKFRTKKRAQAFYSNQVLDHLNVSMQAFIVKQEMVFISTSDAHGACDCSFRAGLPGFIRILNDKRLVYPEYRGNGVLASLGNILENPNIGLMFIDFFEKTIGLHVNGNAKIVENKEMLQYPDLPGEMVDEINAKGGRHPERWVMVEIDEAYIHCSKHIPRLKKCDKTLHWGTDNPSLKGGDFFNAKKSIRRDHV